MLCTDGGLVGMGNLEKLSSIHKVYTLDSRARERTPTHAHKHTHTLAVHEILHISHTRKCQNTVSNLERWAEPAERLPARLRGGATVVATGMHEVLVSNG